MDTLDHKRKTNYCIRMWLLQEVAGCTFLEARVYLCKERNETFEELASAYNMTVHEIQAIEQFANEKASRVKPYENLFHGFEPIYPGEDDTVDW